MRLGIGARLAIGAAIILIAQVGVGLWYLLRVDQVRVLDRARSARQTEVMSRVSEAETALRDLIHPTLELALDPVMRRSVNRRFEPSAAMEQSLRAFIARTGYRFHRAVVADLDGREVAAVDADRQGGGIATDRTRSHVDASWFTGAASVSAIRGVSGPIHIEVDQRPHRGTVLRSSLLLESEGGYAVGVLMLEAALDPILDALVVGGGSVWVMDHRGQELGARGSLVPLGPPSDLAFGPTGNRVVWIDGREFLAVRAGIRPPGQSAIRWTLVDLMPVSEAVAGADERPGTLWLVAAAGASMSLILIVIFTRVTVRPLRSLATQAEEMGSRSFTEAIRIETAPPEVAALVDALNGMRRRLGDSYSLLERQIDELAASKEALIHREADLATTLDSIAEALFVVDATGRLLRCNAAAAELTGLAHEQMIGQPLTRVLQLQLSESKGVGDNPLALVAADNGRGLLALLRPDGSQRWVGGRAAAIDDGQRGGGMRTVLVLNDLTQRRELEGQLAHSQKMEALGSLAGGVAHDFNNLLASMLGFAERLGEHAANDPEVTRMVGRIIEAGGHARELVDQLLAFARRGRQRNEAIDAGAMVESVAELLRHARRSDLVIRVEHGDEVPLLGDRSQLESAVMNLGLNGLDAMESTGGELLLTVDSVLANEVTGIQCVADGGRLARIRVIDTGVGMEPAVAERVFDPFFTTKDRGRGTGLGMSSAYGCVRAHGGDVIIDSTPGVGTTVTVYLPMGQAGEVSGRRPATARHERGAMVLVVDDDPGIRDLVGDLCEDAGLPVLTAADGAEALRLVDEHRLAAIILDLRMPLLDGWGVLEGLRARGLDLPVVVISGDCGAEEARRLCEVGALTVLGKPFAADDLLACLHEAGVVR